ncbi:cutl-25 [Pristionchus pacificus]|nr:cutl-25 [Pristionchus pacificus]
MRSLLALLLVASAAAKTLDNQLIGTPEVVCGPDELRIKGITEDVFEGQIFIKRRRRVSGCAVVYDYSANSTTPELAIKLDRISTCGIEMKRNNEDKSLEIATIVAIAFHPQLMTSGDRSFAVHCVYTQQQMTVATNVDFISDITPSAVVGGTAMPPSLSLSITSQDGSSLADVKLGAPLMLVWTLEQRPSPLFGLRVLGCNAMTSGGEGMRVIDNSCSIVDQQLVSDVRYSEDATRAFADLRAFKFPDSDEIIFQCAVRPCLIKFDHLQLDGSSAGGADELCSPSPDCALLFPSSSSSSPLNRTRRMSDLDSLHPSAHILDTRLTLADEYGSLRRSQGPSFSALRMAPQDRCLSSAFAYSVILGCSIIILISIIAITVLRRKERS